MNESRVAEGPQRNHRRLSSANDWVRHFDSFSEGFFPFHATLSVSTNSPHQILAEIIDLFSCVETKQTNSVPYCSGRGRGLCDDRITNECLVTRRLFNQTNCFCEKNLLPWFAKDHETKLNFPIAGKKASHERAEAAFALSR